MFRDHWNDALHHETELCHVDVLDVRPIDKNYVITEIGLFCR